MLLIVFAVLRDALLFLTSHNLCCLIVDEVSTFDTRIIALLHLHLQQIMQNDLPFGGLAIIFVGDFNQLDPVQKIFIPKDMMTWAMRQYDHQNSVANSSPILSLSPSTIPTRNHHHNMYPKNQRNHPLPQYQNQHPEKQWPKKSLSE